MENMGKEIFTSPIREDRLPLQEIIPSKQPLRVMIDPCDACNLKCKFCFQSYDLDFAGCMMKRALFDKIIQQLQEFDHPVNIIHLFGFGEPMLNKEIADYVEVIKKTGVAKEVAITSNGTRMTKELSEKLVKAGLDRLSISLNGVSDESFYRITGTKISFDEVRDEIVYFSKIKNHCHLHVKINGDDYTEEEKSVFADTFKDIADSIHIDNVVNVWPGLNVTESSKSMYGDNKSGEKTVCPQMFYEMVIHSDGSVSPCCADYLYKRENLGNVMDQTLKEIWTGMRLKNMQLETLKGETISYKACEKCNYPVCASTVNITPYREDILKKYQ